MGQIVRFANSELRTFKDCRRRWFLSYVLRLRKRHEGAGPLSIGNMLHHLMEWYYTNKALGASVDGDKWVEELREYTNQRLEELPPVYHPDMEKDRDLAEIMFAGYLDWLVEEGVDRDLKIQAVETEREQYLGTMNLNGAEFEVHVIAKLDLIAYIEHLNASLFLDHKSVQNLSDLPKTAELDEQMRMYGMIQILEGGDTLPSGGLFNMARKVKRTKTSKPPYYGRHAVRHNPEVYKTFLRRVWGEVWDVLTVRQRLDAGEDHQVVAYPNPGRDCSWKCPFVQVCPRMDDGSDWKAIVEEGFEEHDPYERYVEVEKG